MAILNVSELLAQRADVAARARELDDQIEATSAAELQQQRDALEAQRKAAEAESQALAAAIESQRAAEQRTAQRTEFEQLKAAYPALCADQRAACESARRWLADGPAIAKAYADTITSIHGAYEKMRTLAGLLNVDCPTPMRGKFRRIWRGRSQILSAMLSDNSGAFERVRYVPHRTPTTRRSAPSPVISVASSRQRPAWRVLTPIADELQATRSAFAALANELHTQQTEHADAIARLTDEVADLRAEVDDLRRAPWWRRLLNRPAPQGDK